MQEEEDVDENHHAVANSTDFEKILIEDDCGDLRIRDNSSLSNSNDLSSDTKVPTSIMPAQQHPPSAAEHDRFIPQRNRTNTTFNFEAKEFLFAQKQFNCTHSANEQCDCLDHQG